MNNINTLVFGCSGLIGIKLIKSIKKRESVFLSKKRPRNLSSKYWKKIDLNSKIIKNSYGKFDVLYGANVFNHVDDPINFLKGCKNIVKRSGNIILEVPDLNSLIKSVGFDTIYHEHRHYFSRQSTLKLFENVFKIAAWRRKNPQNALIYCFSH